MNFKQRSAAWRAADAERRKQQTHDAPARDPIFDLPADDRRRIRQAEEQGRREGAECERIEEQARKQAAIDATPEHLCRSDNVYERLIAEHEHAAYRPDVAARVKRYKKLAAEREREIDREMEEKLRQHEIELNPETKPALEHWETASESAESEEEREEWARLKGLIEGGGANQYWGQVAPVMEARLQKVQADVIANAARQEPLAAEAMALAEREKETEKLQVQETPTPPTTPTPMQP